MCKGGVNAYVIYVDIMFAVNITMDIILLFMVKKIRRLSARVWRILAGAFIGALGAVVFSLISLHKTIESIASLILLPYLMTGTAFDFKNIKSNIFNLITIHLISAFLGGMIQIILCHAPLDHDLWMLAYMENIYSHFSYLKLFACAFGAWVLLIYFCNKLKNHYSMQAVICDVLLTIHGHGVSAKGLLDTGNGLYDPIDQKPVGIICYDFFKVYLNKSDLDTIRIIPMRTVGGQSKLLTAVCIEQMEVFIGDQRYHLKNVYMALDSQKFRACEVLLHPDFFR